jgi:hypothetical protein
VSEDTFSRFDRYSAARDTRYRLADTVVDYQQHDGRLTDAVQALIDTYLDGTPVRVEQAHLMANPAVSEVILTGMPLREAFSRIFEATGTELCIQPDGAIVLRATRPEALVGKARAARAVAPAEPSGLDRDEQPFHLGDLVEIAHQDDPLYAALVGLRGAVVAIPTAFNVTVSLGHPLAETLTTFQPWIRKAY